ncbi:MAG: PKD domain-containing protein, partial [Nitrospirota bacterium]
MNRAYKLLLLAALIAMVMVQFMAGTAGAIYVSDGSKQNGTIGADGKVTNWDITDYGVCVTGIAADGTMSIDTSKKSRAACLTVLFPAYTTSAACTSFTNAENSSHYWASTCADASGNPISMEGFDRTAANCADLGGTWTSRCTAAWVYTGPNGDGTPGFCYTTINVTTAYPTAADCPTSITGYTWDATNSKCTYSYGIAGYANANINKKDGTPFATAGTFVDLSTLTQGQCLANGASWSTGTTKSGTTAVATTPNASVAANVSGTRAGCLECHNSTSQYNSYFGRWKDAYLQTGHKNMLRKVTPGFSWGGPDGTPYTAAAASQTLDFGTGTAASPTWGTKTLMYLFGEWMAPAPAGLDTIVWRDDLAKAQYNGVSNYSCAACHTTGWSGINADGSIAGVCSLSSKTTESACTAAGGTWYPSSGVQGASYNPAQPGASWPAYANANGTINGIIGKWDLDGIQCSRCHNVVFSQTSPAPAGTSTHHADGVAGVGINNICFGCHQAIAKVNNNTGADNDLGNPAWNIPVKNTGTSGAYVPEFNGHVLGNQFLNSPHARWNGTGIVPNKLGKYDLVGNTVANYGTQNFYGYSCRASATSANIYETYVKPDKTRGIIHDATTCAEAGGVWVADNETANANANTGRSCATCHNVHESLFDPNAHEPMRRECTTCHKGMETNINHQTGTGTPDNHCDVCHMPKATPSGFPIHLFRINSDPNYSTFPTAADFNGNIKKNANTAPETYSGGTYTNAIWVDLNLACNQCHGKTTPALDMSVLAARAAAMHSGKAVSFTASNDASVSLQVNFDASATECASGSCTYEWAFGDGATATTSVAATSHVYPNTDSRLVTLTVKESTGGKGTASRTVVPQVINTAPAASRTITQNGWDVIVVDSSTDAEDAPSALTVTVDWGNGTTSSGPA